jgi:putative spermidine/putrescine transport system permease protein
MDDANRRQIMRNTRFIPYALLSPILVLYGLFIGGGLIETIKVSLGYLPVLELHTFSLASYRGILQQEYFLTDMLYSVYLAFSATIISTILGVMIAYCFVTSEQPWIKRFVKRALQLGLIIPYLYVIFLVVMQLGQTGFISRILYNIGVIEDLRAFPELVFDKIGFGIICVYVAKGTPFIALFVLNVMARISRTYEDVAKTLHADGMMILRKIYIPLCSRSIIWTSCIVFAYALGSFEVPYLLGSVSPVPLSSKLYSLFINPNLTSHTKRDGYECYFAVSWSYNRWRLCHPVKIFVEGR